MIRLELVCDKCEASKELDLDNFIFNKNDELEKSGWKEVSARYSKYVPESNAEPGMCLCTKCAAEWLILLADHARLESEFLDK